MNDVLAQSSSQRVCACVDALFEQNQQLTTEALIGTFHGTGSHTVPDASLLQSGGGGVGGATRLNSDLQLRLSIAERAEKHECGSCASRR